MEIIIAILLYLHALVGPCNITRTELNNRIQNNSTQIENIMMDPNKVEGIMKEYRDQVNGITVIDDAVID